MFRRWSALAERLLGLQKSALKFVDKVFYFTLLIFTLFIYILWLDATDKFSTVLNYF